MSSEAQPQDETDAASTEALYALRPAVVKAIRDALAWGEEDRVRRLVQPLHYTDKADLLERLKPDERRELVELIRERLDPEALTELDPSVRDEIVEQLGAKHVAAAIAELESDDAVELIDELDDQVQKQILDEMPAEDRVIVEEALSYPDDSAGRLMQRELVAVPDFWTVGRAIDHLREEEELPDEFYDLIVVDPRYHPVGTIPLNRLVRCKRPVRMRDIMQTDMKLIPADMDQEEVALIFRQHDLVSAPVVDADNRLVGVITIDDVVDVIDKEAEEDLLRLAKVSDTDLFVPALTTAAHRIRWLGVALINAIAASAVIALFQATIEQIVALAVLMPIVAAMGGNAGMQVVTVTVRSLAMHELTAGMMWRTFVKEVIVGGLNGIVFAVLTGVVAGVWFQDWRLGLVLAAAMVFNMLWAGIAGTVIPLALDRLKIDPAVAAAPVLTTTTDVLGFLAFLGLAALVLL
ncbi:MAG: magnesium transporter [Alphaproteobacteria bacterium]|nr:magnesium transporter [Alphaproteobacteria bacterium]